MSSSLVIQQVSRKIGTNSVLKEVSLEAAQGDFLVLLGPSGCGKSTLLGLIAGFDQPTRGRILIEGRDIAGTPPADRDIAMVFQSYALYPTMTVRQNMSFCLEMRRIPKIERERLVLKSAKTLQIEHLLDRRPSELSGGQRQRVAMGRALVREPKIFLFDEPLSNLDAKLRLEMRSEIKRLHSSLGTTIVYVTHDQIEALTLATKIAVMRAGEVCQVGTPCEVYDHPATRFVAEFLGNFPMNFVPGSQFEWRESMGDLCGYSVGIRPEHVSPADRDDPLSFEAEIAQVEMLGSESLFHLRWKDQKIIARTSKTSQPSDFARFWKFDRRALHVFNDANGARRPH